MTLPLILGWHFLMEITEGILYMLASYLFAIDRRSFCSDTVRGIPNLYTSFKLTCQSSVIFRRDILSTQYVAIETVKCGSCSLV